MLLPAGSHTENSKMTDGLVLSDILEFILKVIKWSYKISLDLKPNKSFANEVTPEDKATVKDKIMPLLIFMIGKLVELDESLQL